MPLAYFEIAIQKTQLKAPREHKNQKVKKKHEKLLNFICPGELLLSKQGIKNITNLSKNV